MNSVVGIIMGSDSDLPVMSKAAEMLDQLLIPYELSIVSAHRTPDKLYRYAKTAKEKGLKVIIAGAGGAAHLPGMVASMTTLPVIGVPVQTKSLGGVDSLYSIVQMPPGIPVATVAINGALNAGLLAAKILATNDEELSKRVETYAKSLEDMVENKSFKLEELKYKAYLEQM
ncbi:5-(carboxyamino)imidazole ribonucleotide mutase [Candidatus Galacturonibacter soehngenii]|uniref:N5-carboxyaminoimidazole ribonucleotide mutase n=1 Tax=Candidatus Galacturonatibacter soehngenii TaxID=2307010 RepID=A0A7V7UDJ6_9FIRM|nr:5-(carboxyamino)imidazole ribonucleotide mutase [Candidatus Galacturonibacter soehngenii]KAB1441015.1 5-(carboxyamino)imidazole ribonucleotide mutase [Candidatus Galacturonibacter soehngenii]MBA4688414.1 5-(carboxyamino)imidazole ribonucleotide mutase [Candidatus Galacturonibacter soehngenii]